MCSVALRKGSVQHQNCKFDASLSFVCEAHVVESLNGICNMLPVHVEPAFGVQCTSKRHTKLNQLLNDTTGSQAQVLC